MRLVYAIADKKGLDNPLEFFFLCLSASWVWGGAVCENKPFFVVLS